MNALQMLAQASGIAYAAGLNLYVTIGIVGLVSRYGWVGPIPASLVLLSSVWVIALALVLALVEFVACMNPGIATLWDTVHSLIRPPAAAALAAAITWQTDPLLVLLAALIGGTLAVATHITKLGLRYVIDASPKPVGGAVINAVELILVVAISVAIWINPFLTLLFALIVLALLVVIVRLIWRTLRQVFAGRWVPHHGFLQDARTSDRLGRREDDGM